MLLCIIALLLLELLHRGLPRKHPEAPLVTILLHLCPPSVGCLLGALCGGQVCDALGKKVAMLTAFVFYAAGWLLCCLAPSQTPSLAPSNSTAVAGAELATAAAAPLLTHLQWL